MKASVKEAIPIEGFSKRPLPSVKEDREVYFSSAAFLIHNNMKASTEKCFGKCFFGSSCEKTWGTPFWDDEHKGNYTSDITIQRK